MNICKVRYCRWQLPEAAEYSACQAFKRPSFINDYVLKCVRRMVTMYVLHILRHLSLERYSGGTVGVQWGYSEGTVRVRWGYSGVQ